MDNFIFFDPGDARIPYFEYDIPIQTNEGLRVELVEWKDRGGNASIYRCVDVSSGEALAVKFLLVFSTKKQQRFEREIKLLRQLQNDHTIRYRGEGVLKARERKRMGAAGSQRDEAQTVELKFIVMDLAEHNLSKVIEGRKTGLPYEEYAGQFRGLSSALAELHRIAIHRDIKPENILVIGGRWLLSDYGLCSVVDDDGPDLTGQHELVGPRYWLCPEAHNRRIGCGDEITRASDVYQLAAIFWYAVTGRHPSGLLTMSDWKGPEKLFGLLIDSLKHDSTKRPQNGEEFLVALEEALLH